MALTVHDMLDLEAMERFQLVAGIGGLNKQITRVGLIDHEEGHVLTQTVIEGEFLFSNFLLIKDQPDRMLEFIQLCVAAGASCFAMKTIYFDQFPDEVIAFANAHKFPLFTFDETYIEDIILDITAALHVQGRQQKLMELTDKLVDKAHDPIAVRELSHRLNKNLHRHLVVTTLQAKDAYTPNRSALATLQQILPKHAMAFDYHEQVVFIHSYEKGHGDLGERQARSEYLADLVKQAGFDPSHYWLGQSDFFDQLGTLGEAILQSQHALVYGRLKKRPLATYGDLGVYQALIPTMHSPWMIKYFARIVDTLIAYDEDHDAALLETAIAYVEAEGHAGDTAKALFQHVNTVRYRIRKLHQVLGGDKEERLTYESLAVAIHLYLIHNT